ncbi:DoxX family protein [Blastopirellula marina]|uniref:DoxX family protein n=1 Tax=Blastopirellula marina DSM 3645 TaxID=314230 RepID=A3ZST8_9BACT|nr:hypothetical protein [Blastopirellula marina]EAQ80363.1 hypothetical protein DSM3645_10977 [Blastopirellula marina DSM 3645]
MTLTLILLGLLCGPWLIATLLRLSPNIKHLAGTIGITLLFLFAGLGHFIVTDEMVAMLPEFLPLRRLAVHLSGIVEWIAAILVLIPRLRKSTGWFLVVLLIFLLPVNIYAAMVHAPAGGHAWGPIYLLIRMPLQTIMIAWTYYFAARPADQ